MKIESVHEYTCMTNRHKIPQIVQDQIIQIVFIEQKKLINAYLRSVEPIL